MVYIAYVITTGKHGIMRKCIEGPVPNMYMNKSFEVINSLDYPQKKKSITASDMAKGYNVEIT